MEESARITSINLSELKGGYTKMGGPLVSAIRVIWISVLMSTMDMKNKGKWHKTYESFIQADKIKIYIYINLSIFASLI